MGPFRQFFETLVAGLEKHLTTMSTATNENPDTARFEASREHS